MKRAKVRRQVVAALATMLPADEEVVAAGRAWIADRRPRVPLAFTGRALYLVAVTDRRLVVFDPPRRGRPVLEADLRFARRFDTMELMSVRRWTPLLQVRASVPADDREIVVELRRRDRPVGRALADGIAAAAGTPTPTPVPAPTRTGTDRTDARDRSDRAGRGDDTVPPARPGRPAPGAGPHPPPAHAPRPDPVDAPRPDPVDAPRPDPAAGTGPTTGGWPAAPEGHATAGGGRNAAG